MAGHTKTVGTLELVKISFLKPSHKDIRARFVCSAADNANTMAPGSGSLMRGSIVSLDSKLFSGYRPMGLSVIQACIEFIL